MAPPTVTVFGGTGFLGRRVVRHLADRGFAVRVASRHPDRERALFPGDSAIQPIRADVTDDRSVALAVAGAQAVVNAVSLYVERGAATFRAIHVEAAARVAAQARQAGVTSLVHVSGIGADPSSRSPYIRSRGEGDLAVRAAFPAAALVRPSAIIGPDDALLVPVARMLRRVPVFPLFGRGRTRLQPVHVDDVAAAIIRAIEVGEGVTYDLGGGSIYSYRGLIELIARHVGRRPLLLPVPFGLWQAGALLAEHLPHPPVARNQVEVMRLDNVAALDVPGFAALGLAPLSVEQVLPMVVPAGGGRG